MPTGKPPSDEERLPWLEPYRDSPSAKAPVAARPSKRGAGLLIGGIAGIAAALTAGYYIGQREPAPQRPPVAMAEAPVKPAPAPPVPPATAAPKPAPLPPPAPAASPPVAEAAPSPARAKPAPARRKYAARSAKKPIRRAVRQRKIRDAGIDDARLRAVRAAQERTAPRPVARASYRSWPRMPSPGPAGQVIQLGAFKTKARANAAYRTRLARYPSLARMPRVVVPVITKPSGQVLYVLRLGTTSRQQSKIVCRNLRASGDHCIVIG